MAQLDVASERDSGQRGLLEGRDDTLTRGDGEGVMEGSGVTDTLVVRVVGAELDGDTMPLTLGVPLTVALAHTDTVRSTDSLPLENAVERAEAVPYTDGEGEGDADKGGATESSNAKPLAAVAVQEVTPLCTAFP